MPHSTKTGMFLPIEEVSRRLNRPYTSVQRDLTSALRKLSRDNLEHDFVRLVVLAHAIHDQGAHHEKENSCLEH